MKKYDAWQISTDMLFQTEHAVLANASVRQGKGSELECWKKNTVVLTEKKKSYKILCNLSGCREWQIIFKYVGVSYTDAYNCGMMGW